MAFLVEAVVLLIAVGMTVSAALQIAPPYLTSAWLLPLIVGSVMCVLSATLVAAEAKRFAAAAPRASARRLVMSPLGARMAGWLALSVGYGIATPIVGYEWATLAFLACALSIFARLEWWLTAIIAAGFALVVPFVFRNLFFTLVP